MESVTPASPSEDLAPIAANQRIEALDVVRGFALLGIFLMNIEFFNRTIASLGEGMPRGLTGINWFASWFVAYFVQGKFWTIFSLLFGMGFAVMMARAEQAGREFKTVYLRRVLALAVFGAAHFVFLWEGDILFSYAVGALMLMIALYGKTRPLLIGIAIAAGLGFIPDWDSFFAVAAGLAGAGLIALYLRSGKHVNIRGLGVPLFSFLLLLFGALLIVAAAVFWLLPDGPVEPRLPLSVFGPLLLTAGWLSWKYYEPAEKRSVRLGVSLYLFLAIAITAGGLVQRFAPDPDAAAMAGKKPANEHTPLAPRAGEKTEAKADIAQPAEEAAAPAGVGPAAAATKADAKGEAPVEAKIAANAVPEADKKVDEKQPKNPPQQSKEERAAERKAEREKELAENQEKKEKERRIFTSGSYWETVQWSAGRFPEKAAEDFAFGIVLTGMFLLGAWFVRSGVMENTSAHLQFFRNLAVYALPVGIGLGLLSSLIAMSHTPGDRYDGWGIAVGLSTIGNLPACLGYVGMVVLMLHSRTVFSRIRALAPLGRMALTNYLTQSLICAIYFYGYAMGHWGMPRAQQVVFVLVVYAAQIAFSHWWLSRFLYGPMEWLWRGFTYWQMPPLLRR
jgi:uncharacterized membrane protein YeiB